MRLCLYFKDKNPNTSTEADFSSKTKKQTKTKNMQELQQFNHVPPMKIK